MDVYRFRFTTIMVRLVAGSSKRFVGVIKKRASARFFVVRVFLADFTETAIVVGLRMF